MEVNVVFRKDIILHFKTLSIHGSKILVWQQIISCKNRKYELRMKISRYNVI